MQTPTKSSNIDRRIGKRAAIEYLGYRKVREFEDDAGVETLGAVFSRAFHHITQRIASHSAKA
jgi:hypothetical protein